VSKSIFLVCTGQLASVLTRSSKLHIHPFQYSKDLVIPWETTQRASHNVASADGRVLVALPEQFAVVGTIPNSSYVRHFSLYNHDCALLSGLRRSPCSCHATLLQMMLIKAHKAKLAILLIA
jgi:hypothetical protein